MKEYNFYKIKPLGKQTSIPEREKMKYSNNADDLIQKITINRTIIYLSIWRNNENSIEKEYEIYSTFDENGDRFIITEFDFSNFYVGGTTKRGLQANIKEEDIDLFLKKTEFMATQVSNLNFLRILSEKNDPVKYSRSYVENLKDHFNDQYNFHKNYYKHLSSAFKREWSGPGGG